jgi:hypothetical protein
MDIHPRTVCTHWGLVRWMDPAGGANGLHKVDCILKRGWQ